MKKVLALLLAMVLVLSLAACGGGSSSSSTEKTDEVSAGVSDADLAKASGSIKDAQDKIETIASIQLSEWSTSSEKMTAYFDDSQYDDKIWGDSYTKQIHSLRGNANTALNDAKKLLGTNGTGDYYNSVKNYYKAVDVFYNLVSEFPAGYSKLTFSSAVKDTKSKCDEAYSDVSFY